MLAPVQQRRTLLYVLLPGTGEGFEHTEEMQEDQSWFWPGIGEGTHEGARLIRQKQDRKKGWERNAFWRQNHERLFYLLGKGLEPCGECAVGINVTLPYLGTLAAPFLSLFHTNTQRHNTVHCNNSSKFKGQTLKSMTQDSWISVLESAVRLQNSSHPNGNDAWVSLLSKNWDGALFWVHPNWLCSIKVLTYIHCLLRSNPPLFWSP